MIGTYLLRTVHHRHPPRKTESSLRRRRGVGLGCFESGASDHIFPILEEGILWCAVGGDWWSHRDGWSWSLGVFSLLPLVYRIGPLWDVAGRRACVVLIAWYRYAPWTYDRTGLITYRVVLNGWVAPPNDYAWLLQFVRLCWFSSLPSGYKKNLLLERWDCSLVLYSTTVLVHYILYDLSGGRRKGGLDTWYCVYCIGWNLEMIE